MKWLFGVLVALNIIVFAGMVAGRVAERQKEALAPAVPMASGTQELGLPASVQRPSVAAGAASAPGWVHGADDVPASAVLAADEAAERAREQENKEKERKAREEKARREQLAQEKAQQDAPSQPAQCRPTASITLDEDDYHRIKGLLAQWPHAATRTVEQRRSAPAKPAAASKSYRVLLPSGGDAMAQLGELSDKGFGGTLHQGEISVGVVGSKSAAQVLVSRLATAGFSGAYVAEQQESAKAAPADNSLGVSRMQVLFMSVDDKAAKGIQAVVGGYGKLNRTECK